MFLAIHLLWYIAHLVTLTSAIPIENGSDNDVAEEIVNITRPHLYEYTLNDEVKHSKGFIKTKVFGHIVGSCVKSKKLIETITKPNYRLEGNELKTIGDLFISKIGDLSFGGRDGKSYINLITKELEQDQTIFSTVIDELDKILKATIVDTDQLPASWKSQDSVVNVAIDDIFKSIKAGGKAIDNQSDKSKYIYQEKTLYERWLKSATSNVLSDAEKYAIIAYTYKPTVNYLLFSCETDNTKEFGESYDSKAKEALKLQAMLFQSALNKLDRIRPALTVRFDCARNKYKKDEDITVERFTSTINADNIPEKELENELQRVQEQKKTACKREGFGLMQMNFRNTNNGVEISPWARPKYLYQREIIYPVGSKFRFTEADEMAGDVEYEYDLIDV